MTKTKWSKEMHLKALVEINKQITTKDFDTLIREISNNIGVKKTSLMAAIKNYTYIALGKGLANYSAEQKEAVNEFIQHNGSKLFIKL
jgi:hypothetical protein